MAASNVVTVGSHWEAPISAPPREPLDPAGAGQGQRRRLLVGLILARIDDSRGHDLNSLECEGRVPSLAVLKTKASRKCQITEAS